MQKSAHSSINSSNEEHLMIFIMFSAFCECWYYFYWLMSNHAVQSVIWYHTYALSKNRPEFLLLWLLLFQYNRIDVFFVLLNIFFLPCLILFGFSYVIKLCMPIGCDTIRLEFNSVLSKFIVCKSFSLCYCSDDCAYAFA